MKTFYFLAGLPRSGSTVLAAILNQHPDIHTSTTSGLLDVMFGTYRAWMSSDSVQAANRGEVELKTILRQVAEAKYSHIDKPIIIDKSRGWVEPQTMQVAAEVFGQKPKIIATVRDIPDCAASFVRVAKPNDVDDFLRNHSVIDHLKKSYTSLNQGFQFAPECILFVEYDKLLEDSKYQLERIHKFLGLRDFEYDFNNIDGSNLQEKDEEIWQIPGLHNIKPVLKKQHNEDPKDVLQHLEYQFRQPRFWKKDPISTEMVHPLDMQLAAGLSGDFEKGQEIADELAIKEPKNHRAAFNRGWYELRKNNLLDGFKLLERGRIEKVFGNEPPKVPTERWNGQSDCTVLLNLEGGLGDQIHGLRFVRELTKRNCQVIVACSGELALLARTVPGVTAVVQHEAAFGVVHDYWLPSMTALIPLQWQYWDIDGTPYIPKPEFKKGDKFRIGLRWQGNPQFEHEQHRIFPPNLLFDAVKGHKVEYISLQKGPGEEHCPKWVKKVPLDAWTDTAKAVASCDLVISSCTSVAHLAGAMGVPTWVIVPILPYYLWAKEGETTEWYDSFVINRQTTYGDWTGVFNIVNNRLKEKLKGAN